MKPSSWKKAIWAALLTAAFVTATGCGDDSSSIADTAPQNNAEVSVQDTPGGDNHTANEDTSSEENSYTYAVNEDGTITITGYHGKESELNIPATIDGYVVSAIGDHAIEANWDLIQVTLPNGLAWIGESAFMDCGMLASVSIPETVSTVRRAAFASCSSLTNVTLPEATSVVMEEAFTGCGSLVTLTVTNPALEYDRWGIVEGAEPMHVTIVCPSGSAIETWANANGISTQTLE